MKTCLNTGGKLIQELKQRGVSLSRDLENETLIKVRCVYRKTRAPRTRSVGLLARGTHKGCLYALSYCSLSDRQSASIPCRS